MLDVSSMSIDHQREIRQSTRKIGLNAVRIRRIFDARAGVRVWACSIFPLHLRSITSPLDLS